MVNNVCTDVFGRLNPDFSSFLQELQAKKIDNIHSMSHQRINPTGMDPAIAQPHNDQGSVDEDFLDYVQEELIEQPDNSFKHRSSIVAATDTGMPFSAVLPIGRTAITNSSQPIPCSDSKRNFKDINAITNITRIGITGFVDGSTIVEITMLLWGKEWYQRSDFGIPLCAPLF